MWTKEQIFTLLEEVKDPEIPVISLVKLGVIGDVRIGEDRVEVDLVPTFAGCPAIQVMQNDVVKTLKAAGIKEVEVLIKFKQAWTTNQITKGGRKALKDFGLSPPPQFEGELTMEVLEHAQCPKCNSTDTTLKNTFGPTACRAIHHCNNCHETFEQMKPL